MQQPKVLQVEMTLSTPSDRVEEAGCKIYSGVPTVSQTTGKTRQDKTRQDKTRQGHFELCV